MGFFDCFRKPSVKPEEKPKAEANQTYANIAVILVDMQIKFIKNLRTGEAERIIPNQLTVIRHCNQSNIPIVVLELSCQEFGNTTKVLISEAKKNSNFFVIQKRYNSGFDGTNLHSHLESLGVGKLFIMGINADYCVKATALDAIKRGYEIITSNQVIAGQSEHSKDNSIRWFKSNGNCIEDVAIFTG